MPYVYAFDHRHRRPPRELVDRLGGKGANLAEMTSVLGLPVPPGFTVTTEACRAAMEGRWPDGLEAEITRHLRRLEKAMGRTLGAADDPLLVSVRSGARFSMPGMMDTVLDLGLNDQSVQGLAAVTGDERFAYDSYRRFLGMYGRIVLGIDPAAFDGPFDAVKDKVGALTDADVPVRDLRRLCRRYLDAIPDLAGTPFPQDPLQQLHGAVDAVFRSWSSPRATAYRQREGIDHHLGTAVNVQAMVFGNRDNRSGTGVGFTRDPATGAKGEYGDFLLNAQGEDVVAGIRAPEPLPMMRHHFPEIHAELLTIFARLERHYRDMCDTEFTIEQGKLWMLQTRVGKRTGAAALRMAVEMVSDFRLSQREALGRITADHLDQVLHPRFAAVGHRVLTVGLPASPGAAVGHVHFSADSAVEAADRGEPVILVRSETSPEDIHGMQVAEGVLTSHGGLVSHAAVVARGWGIPAVVGAEAVHIDGTQFTVDGHTVREGDVISIDGGSGEVVLGEMRLSAAEPPPELATILAWADRVRRGRLGVRANADTGVDAGLARELGAEGVGLCRTEHMFLAEDRLPVVRRMILAANAEDEAAALEELRIVQQRDFVAILEAMDGLPVTVRLLDPPLHEFLPPVDQLARKAAVEGLTESEQALYDAARYWHEDNPMLGTRGVRLGVLKPGLYAMQARALMEAALERVAAGGDPQVEIMIPLVVDRSELAMARGWVAEGLAAAKEAAGVTGRGLSVAIGTMIETPRAALLAGAIAEEADFFSFGTNDLTQMTFGFSRDDVEARIMPAYLAEGLLAHNPFETLDVAGVGELVRLAVTRGRAARPRLKTGVCGEHGGDPASIAAFLDAGVDYVSCSPYRVPVARLAAAQAVIARDAGGRKGARSPATDA